MTTSLEQRLTDHYATRTADLPAAGPGLPDADTDLIWLGGAVQGQGSSYGRSRMLLLAGAAAALVIGLVSFSTLRSGSDTPAPVAQQPGNATPVQNQALEPASKLPDSAQVSDIPNTAAGVDGPVDWFRLAPDLDIAWYEVGDGSSSMVCWRTPVDEQCMVDDNSIFGEPIPTGGGQTLVLALGPADGRDNLEVALSDGSILSAPIDWSDTIGWGVARFALPEGLTIQRAPTDGAAVLATSPDLVDVPITIVREDGVFSYWRWLPDLDISERQDTSTDAPTELCWRTPVGEGCLDEAFNSPAVGLIPTDRAVIAVVRPALFEIVPAPSDPLAPKFEAGPNPTKVTATLTDGTTVEAPVEYVDGFGLGYARLAVPPGESVVEAASK